MKNKVLVTGGFLVHLLVRIYKDTSGLKTAFVDHACIVSIIQPKTHCLSVIHKTHIISKICPQTLHILSIIHRKIPQLAIIHKKCLSPVNHTLETYLSCQSSTSNSQTCVSSRRNFHSLSITHKKWP